MKITQLRINGIENPMGFPMKRISCSWKVEEATSKHPVNIRIVVGSDEDFRDIIYIKEGKELKNIGESLEFETNSHTRYYWFVEVEGETGESAKSETAWFETGKEGETWRASFITVRQEENFHPEFQREFYVNKSISKARMYICGLGVYEAYINGHKIGKDYLAPFTSDYAQKLQYQTYDVTNDISSIKKKNRVSIFCGNGWYKGRLGYEGNVEVYGNRFAVIAELWIWYKDGTIEVVCTDESWKVRGSDIEESDIYDGEVFNRCLWKNKENNWKQVEVINKEKKLLTERDSLPLTVCENIQVEEILHTLEGDTILDFGQNFAGYVEFEANFPEGTKIELDFGEILQNGNFYNGNYRTAKSRFIYISDGRKEIVRPHFTYFGFRYVRVKGWKGDFGKEDFVGKVLHSELTVTGNIVTSDKRINRLFSNCMWGQKSNFVDMPTDCPQRDERLGWTGDAQVFAPTACFNMDTRAFYGKFLDDLRLEQKKWKGAVPNYIPNYSHTPGGAAVWGDVATFLPMTLYEYYGDKERLRQDYPMMKDWVDWITRESEKCGSYHLFDFGMQFGDWLAMDGVTEQSFKGGTDEYFIASVYYYASVMKTVQASKVLNETENYIYYISLAEQIREAILDEYFSDTGRLCIDTQTAYIISLRFEVYRDKEKVINGLKERLKKDCYRIKCGFVGAPVMCQVLSENGMEDMAYRILFYEGFPGWLRCVRLGATTIWERWNSVLDNGKISGTGMNSLNHYAYGSVIEYFYRQIAGINPLKPGFARVLIKPKLNSRLREMNCSYDSVSGRYVIQWKIMPDGKVRLRVEVPFDCTAVLKLPGCRETRELEPGNTEIEYMPDINYTKPYNQHSTLEELAEDEEALRVLKKYAPVAVGMIAEKNLENMSLSLKDMMNMPYMGFDAKEIEKAIVEIEKITK